MTEFTMRASDGTEIVCYSWADEAAAGAHTVAAVAAVQIVHGSLEHARRYDHVARAFADAGFVVYASDIRGHGRTAGSPERLNVLADEPGGWRLALEDQAALSDHISREHPNVPLFLFGHSMGSFLVRTLIAERGARYCGAILSGTGGGRPALLAIGRMLSRVLRTVRGPGARSPFLHNLLYGTLNSDIPDARTPSDFISRDPAVVDAYIADPMCGATVTTDFMVEFLGGLTRCLDPATFAETPDDLPLLLVSGERDPVAGPNGEAEEVTRVAEQYRSAGVREVTLTLYPEARHELVNELNRDEVIADLVEWIGSHSPGAGES